MTRFNRAGTRASTQSPISSARKPGLYTHEDAPGFKRDARGELFMLGAGRFFGEDSFYEKAHDGADRSDAPEIPENLRRAREAAIAHKAQRRRQSDPTGLARTGAEALTQIHRTRSTRGDHS